MQIKLENLNIFQNNELLGKALGPSGIGLVIVDPHQKDEPIVYVNKGFEQLTGFEASEIIGHNCRFLQRKQSGIEERRQIRKAIKERENFCIHIKNFRKDGSMFWNELNIYPVFIKELNRDLLIGIQKDITASVNIKMENERFIETIHRLTTPILPLSEDISAILLVGDLNEERHLQLLEKVGKYLDREKKKFLIFDLAGIVRFDDQIHRMIDTLNTMLDLMDCELILTAISPEIAISCKEGNFNLNNIRSFTTIERALYFLKS